MTCFEPVEIPGYMKPGFTEKRDVYRGKDYKRDFKNFMTVPCGKCPACLNKRSNEWAFRILQESKKKNR